MSRSEICSYTLLAEPPCPQLPLNSDGHFSEDQTTGGVHSLHFTMRTAGQGVSPAARNPRTVTRNAPSPQAGCFTVRGSWASWVQDLHKTCTPSSFSCFMCRSLGTFFGPSRVGFRWRRRTLSPDSSVRTRRPARKRPCAVDVRPGESVPRIAS